MITVRVEESARGPAREGRLRGARLVDFVDEARAPIPLSCRGGTCGTCRVRVLEGAHLLAPPSAREAETRAWFGEGPDVRLACVARAVAGGRGLLRLVALD